MLKNSTLKIGTRGSNLALYQANQVKEELQARIPELQCEVVIIKTQGDVVLDVALSKIGDKGLFTKELEHKLIDQSIDIAVHSLKDLPTQLPAGLKLGAVLERGEFRDAFVSRDGRKLNELKAGDTVATSSLRRKACLLALHRNLHIVDIRGNVETRLRKMHEGHCDAMVMAAAGLQRLNLENNITEIIESETIIPAVGQGAIAIEVLGSNTAVQEVLNKINHISTYNTILAERSFMHTLQGGCQVPIGCYSAVKGKILRLTGFVASVDGETFLKDSAEGNIHNTVDIGIDLAHKLIKSGAKEILDDIRNNIEKH